MERVAIVGVGGIFPRSPDLERFWANVSGAIDATDEVPPGRWLLDPADAYDPRIGAPDRVYATRGGFIEDFRLDPEGLDLDPELIRRLDPMFHLALHAGRAAWRDAVTEGLDRRRVGVILGNLILPTDTASALTREYLGRSIEEKVGASGRAPESTEPLNTFVAGLPAGVVARALGLGGGGFTLDAACASSLYALKLASDELLAGRADAMITGGLSRPDPLYTQMGFSQLRALAASGRPYPFDARGDGLIVGEGAGMFVLKRLSDALRQGDTIYGVIAGVGLSNDVDGGLLAPSSEGQLRALRTAYERAGWDPRDVDLIECHATGTPVGDAVEFASLKALWGDEGWTPGRCVIGSVKSNIGHALTAAGSAGLLKVLLALRHRVLPPTANFVTPAPGLGYEGSPFRVLNEARPWEAPAGRPRRAAVSGFGFGGINAHVLIEEFVPGVSPGVLGAVTITSDLGTGSLHGSSNEPKAPGSRSGDPVPAREAVPIAVVGMAAHFGPFAGLRAFQERVLGGDIPGAPAEPRNWWGAPESAWFRREGWDHGAFRGYYLDEISLRLDQFRIPPKELEEMLPQQSLMLRVAADAIANAGWDDRPRLRAGVFIGLGLDLNATNFHVRWSLLNKARECNRQLRWGLSEVELGGWVDSLRAAAGPALTANRTMGALGGLVASRIAREFRVGGPSFSVSSEETSGTRALSVATRLLQQGELDEAVVGAVDLAGDLRVVLSAHRLHPFSPSGTPRPFDAGAEGTVPCDGAAALVLKRLDDAERDGDTIYAVVRGIGAASGGGVDSPVPDPAAYQSALARGYAEAGVSPATIGYLEAHGGGRPEEDRREAEALAEFGHAWPEGKTCFLGSVKGDIGHAGAASGLASLVKAALCLHQQILPPLRGVERLRPELDGPFLVPRGPQFWLRDRADGPRRAAVSSLGIDGNCLHVILEAYEPAASATTIDRIQPLGARRSALFAVEADDIAALLRGVDELEACAMRLPDAPIEALARQWWRARPNQPDQHLGLALVAGSTEALRDRLGAARRVIVEGARTILPPGAETPGLAYSLALREKGAIRAPLGPDAGLAFVFPGMSNQFAGMGRDFSSHWPEVLRVQDAENLRLRGQMEPGTFWNTVPPASYLDAVAPILGQVTVGSLISDLLVGFGLAPEAAIGYSLGETAALVSLRAWTDPDELHGRLLRSPLFRTELAGPCAAARRAWRIPEGHPVEWVAGVVPYPPEAVRAALAGKSRVYLLIVNTPTETVIGGERPAVYELVEKLGGQFFPLPVVPTVHCEVARHVEDELYELFLAKTEAPPGVRFYSGAWGRGFIPEAETASAAILAQLVHGFDFTKVIERAYADGIRVFLEAGPGDSCTRMINSILANRPHLARSACLAGQDAVATILDLLARLIAERVRVDLAPLYGRETNVVAHQIETTAPSPRTLKVAVGGRPFEVPPLPMRPALVTPSRKVCETSLTDARRTRVLHTPDQTAFERSPDGHQEPLSAPAIPAPTLEVEPLGRQILQEPLSAPAILAPILEVEPLGRQILSAETAKAEAHEAFLRASNHRAQMMANQLSFQMALIEALVDEPGAGPQGEGIVVGEPVRPGVARLESAKSVTTTLTAEPRPSRIQGVPPDPAPLALDRQQCLEFAVGSIGKVLGPEFAAIDAHPTRVRLPNEPLMLVDRILTIEGVPRSLQSGRVVTEHEIRSGAWYLDCGRIPTGIAVESGQADLFLSGYLGIDFVTKGLACYRLLDCAMTFHRGLPGPGEVIRYDIHIDNFFRQGDTHLFRFRFEATVGGAPFLSMRDGCAGFFTAEELAAGKGIVHTALDLRPRPGVKPDDWEDLVPMAVESLGDDQVKALRRGDLAAAFGPHFVDLPLSNPLRLPGGRMKLVHRVLEIDPTGGRYGLGLIRTETDIHPDDWFLACHFVDDQVMPGTLMYECCLHALRIYVMRLGWVGERDEIAVEPVPGVASRLKCRGQILATTRKATYEIAVKEVGYRPEPYAIVDALMYSDDKPIVEITDLSLRFTGLTRERLREIWGKGANEVCLPVPPRRGADSAGQAHPGLVAPQGVPPDPAPLALDRQQCLEFAVGSIGKVLGPEFAAIDAHPMRVRLPNDPLMLVDRILTIEGVPRSLQSGRMVTEHEIRSDAWYLDCGRIAPGIAVEAGQGHMFLSSYLGIDFLTKGLARYRLLGGVMTFHRGLPGPGEVIRYDIHIDKFLFQGDTHLFRFRFEGTVGGAPFLSLRDCWAGFFTAEELAAGKGIVHTALDLRPRPGVKPDDWEDLVPMAVESLGDDQVEALRRGNLAAAFGPHFVDLPLSNPLHLPSGRMTLVHRVLQLDPTGGRYGLGLIRTEMDIHPDDWFLTCHFIDDGVMPGSLMYGGCLHALRIYLMRLGWVGERDEIAVEPVPGVASRMKCGGQVLATTRKARYEIAVKELGYRPEPYAIVDALIYSDDKLIAEAIDMSLRFTGLTRERLRGVWGKRANEVFLPLPPGEAADSAGQAHPGLAAPHPNPLPGGERTGRKPALFDRAQMLASATGKPSEAFGEPYRIFDEGRFVARLPAPPYSFIDRITSIQAAPWIMAAGGEIEAQYDVPPDAWYFAADHQERMPYAVLLEVALQPCGWFASYMGSALTSDEDLHFRNLGGEALALGVVTPRTGTLTTTVKVTKISKSAGMIIQHYDFEIRAEDQPVYRGNTYFGYFRPEALADQVGIREAAPYRPGAAERSRARNFPYPTVPPLPDEGLCMIDWVDTFVPDGGPQGLGYIEGSKEVNPEEWFFKAHFLNDPVCPGSLGLESFLQLLKVVAVERWGGEPGTAFESPGVGDTHRWVYRGQVVPTNRRVVTQAVITAADDRRRWLKADGYLSVDGRVIYQMNDFTIRCDAETG